jgi:hypothetical protein
VAVNHALSQALGQHASGALVLRMSEQERPNAVAFICHVKLEIFRMRLPSIERERGSVSQPPTPEGSMSAMDYPGAAL